MLLLTRRKHEQLIIERPEGKKIIIKVSDVKGDYIRVGIEAPEDTKISRPELLKRKSG